ncbi:MAG: 2-dehydro-3-deoxyphosphooctonate aldolase [Bergeyella sp.]
MKNYYLIIAVLILAACGTASSVVQSVFDDTYGYSEKNPINVGEHSPRNSVNYLRSLRGPDGEEVSFDRVGSCCHFKTKNALFGDMGLLDKYWVTYEGKKDTVYLYLNIYDKSELGTPKGFTRVKQ